MTDATELPYSHPDVCDQWHRTHPGNSICRWNLFAEQVEIFEIRVGERRAQFSLTTQEMYEDSNAAERTCKETVERMYKADGIDDGFDVSLRLHHYMTF